MTKNTKIQEDIENAVTVGVGYNLTNLPFNLTFYPGGREQLLANSKRTGTEFELQCALMEKELRSGNISLKDCFLYSGKINTLQRMLESIGIPLTSITDANELENALRNISPESGYVSVARSLSEYSFV